MQQCLANRNMSRPPGLRASSLDTKIETSKLGVSQTGHSMRRRRRHYMKRHISTLHICQRGPRESILVGSNRCDMCACITEAQTDMGNLFATHRRMDTFRNRTTHMFSGRRVQGTGCIMPIRFKLCARSRRERVTSFMGACSTRSRSWATDGRRSWSRPNRPTPF